MAYKRGSNFVNISCYVRERSKSLPWTCYNSSSSRSPEDECLTKREFQSVYLVTHSQADITKFQTRKVFAHANIIHRWFLSRCYLQRAYGITVHYLSHHQNYYSTWLYTTKCDREFKESSGHPDLGN